jgi:hypothetical protein
VGYGAWNRKKVKLAVLGTTSRCVEGMKRKKGTYPSRFSPGFIPKYNKVAGRTVLREYFAVANLEEHTASIFRV